MTELPEGTLTVLHTEIESSTLLTLRLGDRYPEALALHRDLIRAAFANHEGFEVDIQGDSFFAVFVRASQAVAAAVAIQRALAKAAWPEDGTVRVRIGLHTGELIRTAGQPGEVLVSQTVKDLVAGSGINFVERGTHSFKGLPGEWVLFAPVIDDA